MSKANSFDVMKRIGAANGDIMTFPDVVSMQTVKAGGHVTIGVPPGIVQKLGLGTEKYKVFLMAVNAREFDAMKATIEAELATGYSHDEAVGMVKAAFYVHMRVIAAGLYDYRVQHATYEAMGLRERVRPLDSAAVIDVIRKNPTTFHNADQVRYLENFILRNDKRCVHCNCSEDFACAGGCSWETGDTCSACSEKLRAKKEL